ncbi:sugar-binding protein [Myroides odoratus]|uniref:sugar-binding protein n=1 Tax=Myroides odoratus TaxID=256 RepID=UPI0039AEFCB4
MVKNQRGLYIVSKRIYDKVIYFLFLLISLSTFSQTLSSSIVHGSSPRQQVNIASSPNVTGFRTFGEFSPSNFIGVVDITVPIHTVTYRNFSMPITLRYHNGMGNKVEAFANTVGLGWHLNSGGVISLIKSKIDKPNYDVNVAQNQSEASLVDRDDWDSKKRLVQLLGGYASGLTLSTYFDDGALANYSFSINFLDYSGELYFDYKNQAKFRTTSDKKLKVKRVDFSRSYVDQSVTGINGFVIVDENAIEYVFGIDENSTEKTYQGHRPTLSAIEVEEFWRIAHGAKTAWYLTSVIFPNLEKIKFIYSKESPFYSTKVFTDLKYGFTGPKDEQNFTKNHYLTINTEQATVVHPVVLKEIETPYSKVVFEYGEASDFSKNIGSYENFHVGTYVGMSVVDSRNGYFGFELNHKKIATFQHPKKLTAIEAKKSVRQLDNIFVYNKKNLIEKEVDFQYTRSSYERRKLLSVNIKEIEHEKNERYGFKYDMPESYSPNPTAYNKDDYGFYTDNKNYFGYIDDPLSLPTFAGINKYLNPFTSNVNLRNQYDEDRKPQVSRFNTWEILTGITYPTGGTTEFEYEANMYGAIARNYPFVVIVNSGGVEKPAGGVRIKSIKSFDSNYVLESSKSYKYVKNFDTFGSPSSGILTHVPTYFDITKGYLQFENGDLDYKRWSTEDIYPADRLRGNHITYSEVAEIDDRDGSFITFKYKNFDNGYHDQAALNYASHYENSLKDENGRLKNVWEKRDVISMGLERGQLLSKTYFKPIKNAIGKQGEKVKEIVYQYNDNPNRLKDHIRVLNLYENVHYNNNIHRSLYAFTYIANLIYTYHPYLKSETEIDYNGTNSIVKRKISYKYNEEYKSLIEKEIVFGGKTYKTTYKYPFDYQEQSVYQTMVNRHNIISVILEEHYIDNEIVFAQKNNYRDRFLDLSFVNSNSSLPAFGQNLIEKPPFPDPVAPVDPVLSSIEKQYRGGNWEKEVDFLNYDLKYNLLNFRNKSGKETSYIWGYNQSLPIWVIDNMPYATIKTLLGDKIVNVGVSLYPSEADVQAIDSRFKISGAFEHAIINHYLYDRLRGLIYKENERGGKEYYEYDGFGRLIKVQDSQKNTLIEYEYNYKQ